MLKFFCFYTLLISLAFGQARWDVVNSPTTNFLERIQFVDSLWGWASGDSGTIIRTTDGGTTWTLLPTNVQTLIQSISFVNRKYGWALTWVEGDTIYYTVVMKTTDGGDTWSKTRIPPDNVLFHTIHFVDSLTGTIGGTSGEFFSTTDGGETWRENNVPLVSCSFFPVLRVYTRSAELKYAVGGHVDVSGVIWRTSDGGENWMATCVSPEPIRAIHFIDSLRIIGVGGDFEYGTGIVYSNNAGATWRYSSLQVFGIAKDIAPRTKNEFWAPLDFAQQFIFSVDTGLTWQVYPLPEGQYIKSVSFLDSTRGFAVGNSGIILRYSKYTDIETTSINNSGKISGTLNSYFQDGQLVLSSDQLLPSGLRLRVFNLTGELIHSEEIVSQTTVIKIPARRFSSGVYFYLLSGFSMNKQIPIHLTGKFAIAR